MTWDEIEPFMIFAIAAHFIECAAVILAIVLLVRHHRATQRQAEALQTLVLRGIQPEQLIKLASTLDRLSETDVEELLASQGHSPDTGPSSGSSTPTR